MGKQQPSKNKLRALKQYRNMSDEEFDEVFDKIVTGHRENKEFENRIQRKIDEFSKDYDLSDLKSNDLLTLRALAQAFITLEDFENHYYSLRKNEDIDDVNIVRIEKINNVLSSLRKDISNLQNDLKITRKIRKANQEESVIAFIETLKQKARNFYESKMLIVRCPKCGTWVGSIWALYPDDKKTKATFHCNRKFPDGSHCDTVFTVSTAELLRKKDEEIPASIQ